MSDIVRVTRHEEFELAHVLTGYNGDCGRLHGHEYRIEVTLEGPQTDPFGMVLDFKDLKRVMKVVIPDHYFVYFEEDEVGKDIASTLRRHGILSRSLPFVTTRIAPRFTLPQSSPHSHSALQTRQTRFRAVGIPAARPCVQPVSGLRRLARGG